MTMVGYDGEAAGLIGEEVTIDLVDGHENKKCASVVGFLRDIFHLAGNVGCRHVGQRVKTTDIFYIGDMSADMSADMSPTCPKNMSAAVC